MRAKNKRKCKACGVEKSILSFGKIYQYYKGEKFEYRRHKCNLCHRAYMKAYKDKNPDKATIGYKKTYIMKNFIQELLSGNHIQDDVMKLRANLMVSCIRKSK